MTNEYVMGLDIGSGSVEAIIVDREGSVVGNGSAILEPFFSLQTGYAEQNPQDWEKVSLCCYYLTSLYSWRLCSTPDAPSVANST